MFGFPPYLPGSRLVGAVSNCAYAVRLETAPTGLPFGRHCFQLCLCGAVRKPYLPGSHLVGAVSNCAHVVRLENRTYRVGLNSVRLETASTGLD